MKCNTNIAFLVIVIRKMHFKKKMQLWSMFGWVVDLRTFTVLMSSHKNKRYTLFNPANMQNTK
jgi:hypothetical protein